MEKIDILLATYNGQKYLSELLESILSQTYENIRILVCDDCSSDDTFKILEEYLRKDERIIVFKNEKNIGSDKTFQFLLDKVESNYFMFADQDDVWMKDKVKLSYEKLIKEDADLVFTDLEVVDENMNTIHPSFNKLKKYEYKIKKCINNGYDLEILYNTITGCTILSKKSWIKKVLPIPDNKNILYDYWIGLIISLKGKVVYLDIPTIKYRQHVDNQVGTSRYVDRFKNFENVRNHLIDIRIQNFDTFINYNEKVSIFSKEQDEFNRKALEYYKMVKEKKNINFKKLSTFHKLYRNDRFTFYISLFCIMNVPIIVRLMYNLKLLITSKKDVK